MRVLAIDASLRNCGVAIVDGANGKSRALFFGTIHNGTSLRSSACLVAIRDRLVQLIREHQPDCCALEAVIYVQSHKTAILLGAARGAAILAAAENGLPVFEYAPQTNQASDRWNGGGAEESGCLHDAGVAWVNRNAGRGFSRRPRDRADPFARPGSGAIGHSRGSADMSVELDHLRRNALPRVPDMRKHVSSRYSLARPNEFCRRPGIAGRNRGAKTKRPNARRHHPVTRT